MSSDGELLSRVINAIDKEGFFESILFGDTLSDWNLARELGEFLVRIMPDSEVMGHALLARAYRRLGNPKLALDELKQCRILTSNRELEPWEKEMLLPLLTEEENLLSAEGSKQDPEKNES